MEIRKVLYDLLVDMFVSGCFINIWEFIQITIMYVVLENHHNRDVHDV